MSHDLPQQTDLIGVHVSIFFITLRTSCPCWLINRDLNFNLAVVQKNFMTHHQLRLRLPTSACNAVCTGNNEGDSSQNV